MILNAQMSGKDTLIAYKHANQGAMRIWSEKIKVFRSIY